jgi:hypothetical protein
MCLCTRSTNLSCLQNRRRIGYPIQTVDAHHREAEEEAVQAPKAVAFAVRLGSSSAASFTSHGGLLFFTSAKTQN